MKRDLFRGRLVRLARDEPEERAKVFARWGRDSEYIRLLDSAPEALWSSRKIQAWIEKNLDGPVQDEVFFTFRRLADDRLIGFVGLADLDWVNGSGLAVIGIGERDCWGRGYGTDAMELILQYGFLELNLHSISLCVFAYNPRAIRSYEKAGFQHEGREREYLRRAGERADLLWMGILRADWLERQTEQGA